METEIGEVGAGRKFEGYWPHTAVALSSKTPIVRMPALLSNTPRSNSEKIFSARETKTREPENSPRAATCRDEISLTVARRAWKNCEASFQSIYMH